MCSNTDFFTHNYQEKKSEVIIANNSKIEVNEVSNVDVVSKRNFSRHLAHTKFIYQFVMFQKLWKADIKLCLTKKDAKF